MNKELTKKFDDIIARRQLHDLEPWQRTEVIRAMEIAYAQGVRDGVHSTLDEALNEGRGVYKP